MKLTLPSLSWIFLVLCSGIVMAAVDERPLDFFTFHNTLHLVGWALLPRIMFIFFSTISGGLFFWLGVLVLPRIMAAYWATTYYWDSNPILCLLAWVFALGGESGEKACLVKCKKRKACLNMKRKFYSCEIFTFSTLAIAAIIKVTHYMIQKRTTKSRVILVTDSSSEERNFEEKRFGEEHDRDLVDESEWESFPCSDPPAHSRRL